jgi:hypothetical protein
VWDSWGGPTGSVNLVLRIRAFNRAWLIVVGQTLRLGLENAQRPSNPPRRIRQLLGTEKQDNEQDDDQ